MTSREVDSMGPKVCCWKQEELKKKKEEAEKVQEELKRRKYGKPRRLTTGKDGEPCNGPNLPVVIAKEFDSSPFM